MTHHFNDRTCGSCVYFTGGRVNYQQRWVDCEANEYGKCRQTGNQTFCNTCCRNYQSYK